MALSATLDQFSAASVRYRIAIGPDAGKRTLAITNPGLAHVSVRSGPNQTLRASHQALGIVLIQGGDNEIRHLTCPDSCCSDGHW